MTVPLVLLAFFAVVLGFLGTPYWPWLQRTLDPKFHGEPSGPGLLVTSIVLVALGDIGAYFVGVEKGRHKIAPSISPANSISPSSSIVPRARP